MDIQPLVDALQTVLQDPVAEDDFVYGMAALSAAGTDVMVNVDPEAEERDDVELPALVERVRAFLAISPEQWEQVVTSTVGEISDAAATDDTAADTAIDTAIDTAALREDLALTSSVVFADAVLLTFIAPLQFPDGVIRVQLDADHRFEDIEVEIEGVEQVTFEGLDELIEHLGKDS